MSDGSQCKRQRHAEDAHSITVSDLLTCTKQRKGQRRVVGDTSESMSHKLPTGSRGVDEAVLQGGERERVKRKARWLRRADALWKAKEDEVAGARCTPRPVDRRTGVGGVRRS